MDIYCKGRARVKHCASGRIYEIARDELDWDDVGGDERQMGMEIHSEAIVDHPDLGELTWGLWEYPVGVENYRDTNVGSHELIEDFDYGLAHREQEPGWLDYAAPEDPFTIYMSSYHDTGDMLADHGKDHGRSLLNRMVFSHQVTALEAYLGDTLTNAVMADEGAIQRLIDGDNELSKEKFTLAEISKDSGLIKRRVREHLRSVLYHNLGKVDFLYELALGIRVLHLVPDKKRLFAAVVLRHDCVHRNGFDRDGNELDVFTKVFVQGMADLIRDFIVSIETAVRSRAACVP